MHAEFQKPTKYQFKSRSKEETEQILKGKDKTLTHWATDIYLRQFKHFLHVKSLPQVEDIATPDLDGILLQFYSSIQPQKKMIIVFKLWNAKVLDLTDTSRRRGVLIWKKKTHQPDRIRMYTWIFLPWPCHKSRSKMSATKLYLLHNLFFLPSWKREFVWQEEKHVPSDHEGDGTEYVIQAVDEMDKNYGVEDTDFTNRGRMYATNGEFSCVIFSIFNAKSHNVTKRD